MVGVLEITFTAFYPRKQHSAVWQNLCCPLLDYMTEVAFTSPLPLWRVLADRPLTRSLTWAIVGRGDGGGWQEPKGRYDGRMKKAKYLSFIALSSVPFRAGCRGGGWNNHAEVTLITEVLEPPYSPTVLALCRLYFISRVGMTKHNFDFSIDQWEMTVFVSSFLILRNLSPLILAESVFRH